MDKLINYTLKTLLFIALFGSGYLCIAHGSSAAFELGLFLCFMGLLQCFTWEYKREGE